MPPTTKEVYDKLGNFVSLRLPSGHDFRDALLLEKGECVTLMAEREGFESIKIDVTAETDNQVCKLPHVKWSKKISTALFDVKSKSGKNLNGKANISVNGKDITAKPYFFNEEECENADVVVSVPGYDSYEENISLLAHHKFNIVLDRKIEEVKKRIILKNGNRGDITIVGKGIDSYESPILGYIESNGYLEYRPENKWLQRLIGFGVAVLLWLISLFIGWWNNVEFHTSSNFPWIEAVSKEATQASSVSEQQYTEYTQLQEENEEKQTPTSTSNNLNHNLEDAIKYLDDNKVWKKCELEGYSDLQDLYDDLNQIDTYKLTNTWKEKLKKSSNFKKIVKYANRIKSKTLNSPYNKNSDDYTIVVETYINTLSNAAIDKKESQNSLRGTTVSSPQPSKSSSTQQQNDPNVVQGD